METAVIRKRLSTFKSAKGTFHKVSNEVVMEVLRGWEAWPGNAAQYYREIGVSKTQLAVIIGKAKRLVKSGAVTESEFKEIGVSLPGAVGPGLDGLGMELRLEGERLIRFSQVDHLVDFLRKMS